MLFAQRCSIDLVQGRASNCPSFRWNPWRASCSRRTARTGARRSPAPTHARTKRRVSRSHSGACSMRRRRRHGCDRAIRRRAPPIRRLPFAAGMHRSAARAMRLGAPERAGLPRRLARRRTHDARAAPRRLREPRVGRLCNVRPARGRRVGDGRRVVRRGAALPKPRRRGVPGHRSSGTRRSISPISPAFPACPSGSSSIAPSSSRLAQARETRARSTDANSPKTRAMIRRRRMPTPTSECWRC